MDRSDLVELARSYQKAALVMSLTELGICSALEEFGEGATPQELAARLELEVRSLAALLAAAAALGLLEQREGRYFNSALSRDYLVESKSSYLGFRFKSYLEQYQGWGRLPEAVRHGEVVLPSLHHDTASSDQALKSLLNGLHYSAQQVLPAILSYLSPILERASGLLDVGCGLGTYALSLAERFPSLEVTLLDQPGVLKIARELVESSPARSRVRFYPANYHKDDFGKEAFDLILMFQVLRTESPANLQMLLAKAARALTPGGVIAIYDSWLEEDHSAPLENVLQNLTMAMMYREGGLFTLSQLAGWLKESGLKLLEYYSIKGERPMVLYLAGREGAI